MCGQGMLVYHPVVASKALLPSVVQRPFDCAGCAKVVRRLTSEPGLHFERPDCCLVAKGLLRGKQCCGWEVVMTGLAKLLPHFQSWRALQRAIPPRGTTRCLYFPPTVLIPFCE